MVAEDEERKLNELAPRIGFCLACEEHVDEAAGRLHAPNCQWAMAERRRAS